MISNIDFKQKWKDISSKVTAEGNRERKFKVWVGVLTSLIILSFLTPMFAWFDTESGGAMGSTDKLSGISYLLELVNQDFPESPFIIAKYIIVIISALVILISSVLLLLKTLNVWKPNMKGIQSKLIKFILFGTIPFTGTFWVGILDGFCDCNCLA